MRALAQPAAAVALDQILPPADLQHVLDEVFDQVGDDGDHRPEQEDGEQQVPERLLILVLQRVEPVPVEEAEADADADLQLVDDDERDHEPPGQIPLPYEAEQWQSLSLGVRLGEIGVGQPGDGAHHGYERYGVDEDAEKPDRQRQLEGNGHRLQRVRPVAGLADQEGEADQHEFRREDDEKHPQERRNHRAPEGRPGKADAHKAKDDRVSFSAGQASEEGRRSNDGGGNGVREHGGTRLREGLPFIADFPAIGSAITASLGGNSPSHMVHPPL